MRLLSVRPIGALAVLGAVLVACGAGDSSQGDFGLDSGGAGSSSGISSSSGGGKDGSAGEHDSGTGSSSGSTSSSGGSSSGGSSSGGTSSSGGGSCGACTTDSECQSSCPPVQGGGTNCCDVGSGVCYATTQNTCPVPSDGGAD
jgi:hypothetical protein